MKANYENDPLVQEGKEKAKKYAKWAKENNIETLNDWAPLEKGSELSSGMTMYDMAKQGAAAAPPLSKDALEVMKHDLENFITNHLDNYYMMLCHEKRDYTIFHPKKAHVAEVAFDIIDCLQNRGDIVEYELQEGGVELWIKDELGEGFAYYFFPYGEAVLEYDE